MTPVLLQQFRLFYAQDRPLGVVLWGQVSDDVEKQLISGQPKLQPTDWKSGEKIWAVEVIAPFGGAEEMVNDVKKNVFPERDSLKVPLRGAVHYVTVTKEGKKEVRVV